MQVIQQQLVSAALNALCNGSFLGSNEAIIWLMFSALWDYFRKVFYN